MSADDTVRIATRRSPLAMAQASQVAARLSELCGRSVVLSPVVTTGDVSTEALSTIGGTGVFVGAVRDAVLAGDAEIAVHSLKDLPTAEHRGLAIAAIPVREDPRDALCADDGQTLAELGPGARVGTGSPRRAAQLRALRPDLEIVDIRGNVDTRLAKVTDGELDAVVLAVAGLTRLGRDAAITEAIDPEHILPAPGQGALAVESRADLANRDPELARALAELNDPQTHVAVTAERALLNRLEAGCSAPVGALATITSSSAPDNHVHLEALTAGADGTRVIRMSATGPASDAGELGRQLAVAMLAAGAAHLLGEPSL
ncbi:MAG: hydroxymethylbilane synthase [Candidatus Nanopelagicales bacterium]